MAIYVNMEEHMEERLDHDEVARRLSATGQTDLAVAVRQLGEAHAETRRRYAALLSEHARLQHSVNKARPVGGSVSYKPGPMSDG